MSVKLFSHWSFRVYFLFVSMSTVQQAFYIGRCIDAGQPMHQAITAPHKDRNEENVITRLYKYVHNITVKTKRLHYSLQLI
jgi:hypothetical protein